MSGDWAAQNSAFQLEAVVQERDRLLTEIERLRAALREYACTGTDHPCGCYAQFLSEKAEIERLTAHNANLLAALRPFADARIVDATMRGTASDAIAKVEGETRTTHSVRTAGKIPKVETDKR